MKKILASVAKIESCAGLHIVHFNFNETSLVMMSLELDRRIKIGTEVSLLVKATNVSLAKNFQGALSDSNQLNATIRSVRLGQLLCALELDVSGTLLESVITSDASTLMQLEVGDRLIALIKASDLSIGEILDD